MAKPTKRRGLEKLTIASVKNAPVGKHFDGGGLFFHVTPTGGRYWRLKYRYGGRERLLALGVFPDVGIAEAREVRAEARQMLRNGIDPMAARREKIAASRRIVGMAFSNVAATWLATRQIADITRKKTRWLIETFLNPSLGMRPLNDIKPRDLLDTLRKIESTGKLETAKRAKIVAGQVFRYAIVEGLVELDPTASLRGALLKPNVRHHAAITDPAAIGQLLRAIDGFTGQFSTAFALKLAPLVFVRPGELRYAVWNEFDLKDATWRIPASRMKMKAAHLVPLSKQAIALLGELWQWSGDGTLLFPSIRSPLKPISDNTLNAALRRLGYADTEMTAHGFRSMAATRLNEMGWRADAIERQLAHAEQNKVRDAYTSAAEFLQVRREMMQAWADYLDGLRKNQRISQESFVSGHPPKSRG
jgi:integrase